MVHEHVVLVPVLVPATKPLPILEVEAGPVPVPLLAADPLPVLEAEAGSIPILVPVPHPIHVPDPEAEAEVEADRGMPSIYKMCIELNVNLILQEIIRGCHIITRTCIQ